MKSFLWGGIVTLSICQSFAATGRQLSGQWAPTMTPALAPEVAQKKFTVPEGFEMRLFASEPMVVNPVAMTWDERGRFLGGGDFFFFHTEAPQQERGGGGAEERT